MSDPYRKPTPLPWWYWAGFAVAIIALVVLAVWFPIEG